MGWGPGKLSMALGCRQVPAEEAPWRLRVRRGTLILEWQLPQSSLFMLLVGFSATIIRDTGGSKLNLRMTGRNEAFWMSSLIGTQQHRPSGPGGTVTDKRRAGRGTQCGPGWWAAECCTRRRRTPETSVSRDQWPFVIGQSSRNSFKDVTRLFALETSSKPLASEKLKDISKRPLS